MNMQIDAKGRNLLIGLLGVLLVVIAWFVIASPMKEKTAALSNENASLKVTADEYSAANARLEEYQLGIANNTKESEEILSRFPVNITTQDQLMFWTNIDSAYPLQLRFGDVELEERDPVAVSGVDDLGGADVITNDDGSAQISDEDVDRISAAYVLYGAPTAMAFASTYDGMKNMFRYINDQYDRNAINGVSIEYDEETGLLKGTVTVELYYIEGTGKEYSPAFIPSVPKGQSDLFNTGLAEYDDLIEALEKYSRTAGNAEVINQDELTQSEEDTTEESDETTEE